MQFVPFFNKCPEVADNETRTAFILNENEYGIPKGQYVYIENYCNDPKCDCRKVMINVFQLDGKNSQIFATIGFGWEDVEYYSKWLHGDTELAKEMKGASIELGAPQSQYSKACLAMVKSQCLNDSVFINRLKEHYHLFKQMIKKEGQIIANKIGRNEPCPCGSGRKFKHCCLNKN